jgi:NAD(P)-dependent dehydrogenase (short-subunit alcohol dehydrogenase family)
MNKNNAIALVTGANRSIGVAFTRELLARGARKVYARCARSKIFLDS